MAGRMDPIRDWLSRNEIIFKTVAATLLSLMAVTVAMLQFCTARDQLGLAGLQARIAEANALPVFDVAIHQKLNQATGKFDDNYMEVVNSGGPVHDFTAEPMYFLSINASMKYEEPPPRDKPQVLYGSTSFDVPVNGYFAVQEISAVSKGTLATMRGYRNNAALAAIVMAARQMTTHQRWLGFVINEHSYVRLQYRDLLDRAHEDFYDVSGIGSGSRMPDEAGRTILDRWRSPEKVELSNLTAEKLITDTANRITSERPKL